MSCSGKSSVETRVIYVSSGQGSNLRAPDGSLAHPYTTLRAALRQLPAISCHAVTILLRQGRYYPDSTLVIDDRLVGDHSLTIAAYEREQPIISGARLFHPNWTPYKDRILTASIGKGLHLDQLFCNGHHLPMARYPNFDSTARVFNGTDANAISPERVKKWHHPAGGYVHALHQGEWGSFHYRIKGADAEGRLQLEGGWQMNRQAPMHAQYRFVENIFEELDAPGEWYYDPVTGFLYLIPPANVDLSSAVFEYSTLDQLVVIRGTPGHPVKNVVLEGIGFTETNRTFMSTREPLLRTDWAIYRGGAVLLDQTEDCRIAGCTFHELGGNAIFLSNYNKENSIEGNEIDHIGASAICLVGSPSAVRSPDTTFDQLVPIDRMDKRPGPATPDYPANCLVSDNLIHDIGTIEKQVAGVEIDMAADITVRHNTIYQTPRAGINIGDGCWGGHIVEYNEVFNTVLETGDHGAFNAWGRDRYFLRSNTAVDSLVQRYPDLPFADAVQPVILRNNLFYCDRGWDIDLDDGASNYHIYDNLCLNGGLKLRQGYARTVENNILINNSFHAHVWFADSRDIFRYNILGSDYSPIGMTSWGKEVDSNFFMLTSSLQAARLNGTDTHSIAGEPLFLNPAANNYTVSLLSPALEIGFRNFPMDSFGVTDARLRLKAAKPPNPGVRLTGTVKKGQTLQWRGAEIKNIESMDERSAAGLPDQNGVWIVSVAAKSLAARSGLQARDVIRTVNDKPIHNITEFLAAIQVITWQGRARAGVIRNQQLRTATLLLQ